MIFQRECTKWYNILWNVYLIVYVCVHYSHKTCLCTTSNIWNVAYCKSNIVYMNIYMILGVTPKMGWRRKSKQTFHLLFPSKYEERYQFNILSYTSRLFEIIIFSYSLMCVDFSLLHFRLLHHTMKFRFRLIAMASCSTFTHISSCYIAHICESVQETILNTQHKTY